MEWIKNLKIAQKLYLLVGIAAVIVLFVSSVGFYYTNKANKEIEALYNVKLLAISALADLQINTNKVLIDNLNCLQNISPQDMASRLDDMEKLRAENGQRFKDYVATPLDPYEQERVDRIPALRVSFWAELDKSIYFAKIGKKAQGYQSYKKSIPSINEYRTILSELLKYNQKTAEEIFAQNIKDAAMAKTFLIVSTIAAFLLLLSLGLMIINMITRPIKHAIEGLNLGTEEVSSASTQVAAASQQLAEGTSEQAASIQETSSTLEETSSMVHQNRENTQQAAVLAKQAKQFAEKSHVEMAKMSTSMQDLKNSSNEIAKIIKVIDEIAFQTNILSLNAAVEAARAGDAGKGFAVVAEEVRNLAQRSAQAAKDTAVIIESNINLSDTSVDIAKVVRESVESIGVQATKVSDLLDEISVATDEQAQGVEQINKAVSQMEIVLSSNAQTAEEAASASCALQEQAINVKEIVNTLIVLVDGAEALRGQPQRQMAMAGSSQRRITAQRPQARPSVVRTQSTQSPESIIPLNDF